jgi:cephalosporin-C deacetylase-like acetyl esterase
MLAGFASAGTQRSASCSKLPWDTEALFQTPTVYETDDCPEEGVESIFYQGLPYEGNQTRGFAFYGLPEEASEDKKVPGVVLVHGGGGTAFAEWVRIWNERGYAAIAMDLEGRGHAWSGPNNQEYKDIAKPVQDQWMYHAVADVLLGHSLLRSFKQVDADRIGLTGISWGGIITNNVVGVDHRFSFAIPVYGCSYLYEMGNHYQKTYESHTPEQKKLQRMFWDGSAHLPRAKMPIFWLNGTNDFHFYPDKFYRSARLAPGTQNICMKVEMLHSHTHGWAEPEIYAFADSIVNDAPPLATILDQGSANGRAWVRFSADVPVESVGLVYTADSGIWHERKWHISPAEFVEGKAGCDIPDGTTVYYFNVTDERGLTVSSDLVELAN